MAKHHRTGKIRHKDMGSLLGGKGGRDKMAHESHHKANREAGMPEGMSPKGGYGEGEAKGGGEEMGENEDCCD